MGLSYLLLEEGIALQVVPTHQDDHFVIQLDSAWLELDTAGTHMELTWWAISHVLENGCGLAILVGKTAGVEADLSATC
jgi:hypothetical protein